MINYYRINVSQDGKYLFATENGDNGSGITNEKEARKITELFKEKFPESEGYKISVTHWKAKGIPTDF